MGFRCKCWRTLYRLKSDRVRFRSTLLRFGGTAQAAVATRVVLLPAQQADSRGERPAQAGRKRGLRMRCVDHAVYHIRITTASNVIEATTQCQVVTKKVKAFFQLQVHREIFRETLRPGFPNQLLLIDRK